jgi:hypothetical protein
MTAFLWCLAVISAFCAGHFAVRSEIQMRHWRALKAARNIQSAARREAAERGLWLFAFQLAFMLATVVFGLVATFGVAS